MKKKFFRGRRADETVELVEEFDEEITLIVSQNRNKERDRERRGAQRARERREERGRPLAWQSLQHMPSSLSGVYVCVCAVHWFPSTTSACLLLHLLSLVYSFVFSGFWLRLCLSVFLVGLFAFSFFFLLLLFFFFQLVCLDCERKIQAFVCGNWLSFAVGGLKVSRRRARGDLWGGEGT